MNSGTLYYQKEKKQLEVSMYCVNDCPRNSWNILSLLHFLLFIIHLKLISLIHSKHNIPRNQTYTKAKPFDMALARLALKNLQQRASVCKSSALSHNFGGRSGGAGLSGAQEHGCSFGLLQKMSSSASNGKEVAVKSDDQSGKKGKWKSLLPRRFSKRPTSLWRRKDTPDPFENMPVSSLGNALMEAAENMNRLFENVIPSQLMEAPTQLMGRFKETNNSYKLRYDVPGLTHDDIKVRIKDGVLKIQGERKVEEGEETEDEYWMSYGSYNSALVLPDDAKQDDIKAELKDGVLTITIPKSEESHSKDVKEIQIE